MIKSIKGVFMFNCPICKKQANISSTYRDLVVCKCSGQLISVGEIKNNIFIPFDFKSNEINVKFVSVWEWVEDDSDRVVTDAKLDLSTGKLTIETSDLNTDSLIDEFILFNGMEIKTFESNGCWYISEEDLNKVKM